MKIISLTTAIVLFAGYNILGNTNYIINATFNTQNTGKCSIKTLKNEFPGLEWASIERLEIVSNLHKNRSKVLQVTYPRGAVGPSEGGAQFLVKLKPCNELWLSYHVYFKRGFDFRKGGKLPGLTSGGSKFTGGNKPKNGEGWSARYMWKKDGQAILYLYYVDMKTKWGENIKLKNFHFRPGQWYHLVQHIKLNNNNKSDGIIEIWINQKKVLSKKNIKLRLDNKGLIDSFYFSTFHGGNTPDWGPYVKSTALFDDFLIYEIPLIAPEK